MRTFFLICVLLLGFMLGCLFPISRSGDDIGGGERDNGLIAFQSYSDGDWEIYMMDADGCNQTNLTDNTSWDLVPHWCPVQ